MTDELHIPPSFMEKLMATMELIRAEHCSDLDPITPFNYLQSQEIISERLGMTVTPDPANPTVSTSATFRRIFFDAAERTGLDKLIFK